jgi:hypothetical protein
MPATNLKEERMNRFVSSITVFCILGLVASGGLSVAAAEGDTHHHETIAAKVARMASPTLADDPGMMKGIAKALGNDKGILAAKYETDDSLLMVTFDPEATTIETIQKALAEQLPDLTLKDVEDAKWEAEDCGKCPLAAKCAKQKEQATSD